MRSSAYKIVLLSDHRPVKTNITMWSALHPASRRGGVIPRLVHRNSRETFLRDYCENICVEGTGELHELRWQCGTEMSRWESRLKCQGELIVFLLWNVGSSSGFPRIEQTYMFEGNRTADIYWSHWVNCNFASAVLWRILTVSVTVMLNGHIVPAYRLTQ